MLNSKLIAFMGPIGCGKTLAADYLVRKGYVKLNFKDALIRECERLYPMLLSKLSSIHGIEIDRLFCKPYIDEVRCLLQDHGKLRRDEHAGYWVTRWQVKYNIFKDTVVDDCRHVNEFDIVKDMHGLVIRIDRPGIDDASTHESEKWRRSLVPDKIIVNDGTKEQLYKSLDSLIS